jgi:hypothetical protein
MNLVELALTTYTEGTAAHVEQDEHYAVQAREELLRLARACAGSTLCTDAASLEWQYATEGLPEQVEEARAFLVLGRPEYLRYRIDHDDVDNVSFDLVRPCLACGHDRIATVNSLFHLGQLLHQEEERSPDAPAEAAPLTVFRASHDSIPLGLYATAAAARAHCEAEERRSWPTGTTLAFAWVEDVVDGVAELAVTAGQNEESATRYVVTALEAALEYAPDGEG